MRAGIKILMAVTMMTSGVSEAACRWIHMPTGFMGGSRRMQVCTPDPAPNKCAAIYQHGNFGGKRWAVIGNDANMDNNYIERRRWRGNLRGWSGSDKSWSNTVSSVQVSAGCSLTLYDGTNFSGAQALYEGTDRIQKFSQVSPNDKATSFKCKCESLIGDVGFLR